MYIYTCIYIYIYIYICIENVCHTQLGWTKISDYVSREWSTMPPADTYQSGSGCDSHLLFQGQYYIVIEIPLKLV